MTEEPQRDVQPEPLLKGRFALYETPDGGYHLSYRPDAAEDDEHVQIPGMYVKLFKARGGPGGLRKMLKGLVG